MKVSGHFLFLFSFFKDEENLTRRSGTNIPSMADYPFAAGPLTSLSTTVKQLAAMKIDLMLVHADLLLMRSALADVRNVSWAWL